MSDKPNLEFFPENDYITETSADNLVINVDGFEGPLDLLLALSRTQKVDLLKISISQLASQYLAFVAKAKEFRIELAADYLVMAAWLAFLKSRLLLPADPGDDGPSGEELSAILAFRLERLQAMRNAGAKLMARNQLGKEFFSRGLPENLEKKRKINYTLSLLDLMQGYARIRTRDEFRPFSADRENVFTMESALDRMRKMLDFSGEWSDLMSFLPVEWQNEPKRVRAATAATFAATLELVKAGNVELRQAETFAKIELRKRAVE